MKYITLILGILALFVVTIFNFFPDEVYNLFNKEEKIIVHVNEYYLDNQYNYIKNYTDDVNNYNELLNFIYYIVNSGATTADGECTKKYTNCIPDLENIANNKELLSIINNFVHPFNSFDSIVFNYSENGKFSIEINRIYSDSDIIRINDKVNTIIKDNISDSMNNYDKVKAIHDYIIDNTNYDTLKTDNIGDVTYKSNTAYGVLFQNYGICSGYSDTMSIFLHALNISNYKISNTSHIWNLVNINGKWLHIDLTWDDPIYEKNLNRDTYFLIDSTALNNLNDNTHSFDKKIFSEAS